MKSHSPYPSPHIATEGTAPYPSAELTAEFVQGASGFICRELSLDPDAVVIILCDDPYIAGLNGEYRGKTGPTDVISFAYGEGEPFPVAGEPEEGGDIFISLDTALRQAREQDLSFRDEVLRLIAHGLLHLAGYDHERGAADEREMFEKEEALARAARSRFGKG